VDVAKNPMEASSCADEFSKDDYSETASHYHQAHSHADGAFEMAEIRRPVYANAASSSSIDKASDVQDRLLGPKRLCFVNEPTSVGSPEYRALEVSQWQRQNPGARFPRYLFVSYTSEQFATQSKETLDGGFGSKMTDAEKQDRLHVGLENRRALASLAASVARQNGLDAFWIDYESGIQHGVVSDGDDPGAYAICDILRASKSMIIVAGPPYRFTGAGKFGKVERKYNLDSRNEWLASWGERLWTLPELLFCPNSDGIAVHTLNDQPPEIMSKHTIATLMKDGKSVRELIEHYSGTIQLSPLELTVTATQCLFARPYNQYSPGDASYALMGLMRRRPKVNEADSAFKAFARLSLLNDNDRLLERLICLQPDLTQRQPWYSLQDAYHASLWDVEPCIQVAGIVNAQPAKDPSSNPQSDQKDHLGETQIIVLDGAFGAAIKWERLERVAFLKRSTLLQLFARFLIRGFSGWFFFGLIMTIIGGIVYNLDTTDEYGNTTSGAGQAAGKSLLGTGLPFLILSVPVIPFLPGIVRRLYAGKLWATQAAFFGVTGIPELSEVERCIFGFNQNRLTWSTHSSTLSTASINPKTGELLPQQPNHPGRKTGSKLKTYTLIDTFTLTATAFEAEHLPVAAIICGQEGGMQRALLCSYDPATRAFCKEAVLRMKTVCLERMPRIDRFRFAMRRG
jgi:hypothetical protein